MYYWFTNPKGAVIIVSPYYEGDNLFNFVGKFERDLEEDLIYKIFG